MNYYTRDHTSFYAEDKLSPNNHSKNFHLPCKPVLKTKLVSFFFFFFFLNLSKKLCFDITLEMETL